jgi:hypothetical protein
MFLSSLRHSVERTLPASRQVGRRPRSPRLHCEELEPRRVPSAFTTGAPAGAVATISAPPGAKINHDASGQPALPLATQGNLNGAAGVIPAFFNGQSVAINVKELSDTAAASIIAHNKSLQIIYVTNDLDEPQEFAPVINAVPGQGFNALWLQIRIDFTGSTPHQFTSEADILTAAGAGAITLTSTGEVYRDSVVGVSA